MNQIGRAQLDYQGNIPDKILMEFLHWFKTEMQLEKSKLAAWAIFGRRLD